MSDIKSMFFDGEDGENETPDSEPTPETPMPETLEEGGESVGV